MRIVLDIQGTPIDALKCDTCSQAMLLGRKGPERKFCSRKCRQKDYYRRTRKVTNPWT